MDFSIISFDGFLDYIFRWIFCWDFSLSFSLELSRGFHVGTFDGFFRRSPIKEDL